MRRFAETIVGDHETDTLGHMNVTFYIQRVLQANKEMFDAFGLDFDKHGAQNARLSAADTYNRFHREQFPGATLAVQGGVLDAHENGARLYYEVLNTQKNELAAAFIIAFDLIDSATRAKLPLPADVIARANERRIDIPDHGKPRSINLDIKPRFDMTYNDLIARLDKADKSDTGMGGRMQRVVEARDCDAFGYFNDEQDMMFGGRHNEEMGKRRGPPTFTTEEGHRFGWAFLETRSLRRAQPRIGETLEMINAEIGIGAKTRHSRRWVFNRTTGELASVNDMVSIALDLDARRAINVPVKVRESLERAFAPDLA